MSDSTGTIIACVSLTVVTTIAADFMNTKANGKPTWQSVERPVLGGAVAGFLLLGVAMANDAVAKDFAILLVLGSLLSNGNGLISLLDRIDGTTPNKAAPKVYPVPASVPRKASQGGGGSSGF